MKPTFIVSAALTGAAFIFTGCGKKASAEAGHDHSAHAETEGAESGVAYKPGRGLTLSPQITKALGLTTVEATERSLAPVAQLTAHVFATQPTVLASARLPLAEAEGLEQASFQAAKLVRIDRSTATATRLVDAVFALDRQPAPAMGDFVTIALATQPVTALAVPHTAVLDGATGTFVYVLNGESYLRTPVKLGARSADFIAVTDGLYAGDFVVVSPVDQLWLAELRLTKGGGHSH